MLRRLQRWFRKQKWERWQKRRLDFVGWIPADTIYSVDGRLVTVEFHCYNFYLATNRCRRLEIQTTNMQAALTHQIYRRVALPWVEGEDPERFGDLIRINLAVEDCPKEKLWPGRRLI